MASSTRAAQFMKALTRIVWRVIGRRTSLRLVQCTKANSGISSTWVLQRSIFLSFQSSRQLSHACAPRVTKCIGRASAVIPVELATNCGFRNRTIFLTPKWGPRFVIKTQRQRQHVTQLKKAFVSSVGFAFALATAFAFAAMTTVCSLATTTLSHSAFYEPQARQRRQPKRRMGIIPLTVLRAPNILGALCSFLFFPNASQRVLV